MGEGRYGLVGQGWGLGLELDYLLTQRGRGEGRSMQHPGCAVGKREVVDVLWLLYLPAASRLYLTDR